MGTRADFYVGKGATAEWIGSIGWDGYRSGIDEAVLNAHDEQAFRAAVSKFFAGRGDATLPDRGWPWPWDTSATSDCHYWFFDGRCWDGHSNYPDPGEFYVPCDEPEPRWREDGADEDQQRAAWLAGREMIEFPDMSARKNVTLGPRSGLIVIGAR